MPSLKTYDIFVSHAWIYGTEYQKLINLLSNANNFYFRDYSAPEYKPIVPIGKPISDKRLKEYIDNKIRPVNAVLVLSGMYYNYHKWMQEELNIAQKYSKPVIAIRPRGNILMPTEVEQAACITVGWYTDSIVSAVRKYSI